MNLSCFAKINERDSELMLGFRILINLWAYSFFILLSISVMFHMERVILDQV